jgi:bifunctional non-homologous end joining protein LigD
LVVVFDLDPGPPANITECCRVALTLRRVLGDLGLDSLPKTSGSKGLHVYVPLNTSHDHDETKAFARGVARILASDHPDIVVDRPQRGLRSGRVLVDWSQNDASKSIVAPYSLRGGAIPIASTPLSWSEVEAAVRRDDASTLVFSADRVLDRLDSVGDLFRPVLETRQTLSS